MGGPACNGGIYLDLARSAGQDLSRISARIENHGLFPLKHGIIHIFRAVHSALFSDGKEDVCASVGQILFLNNSQGLHNGRNAGFIIACQDGGAVGADNAVFDHRPDPVSGSHRIHMGTEDRGISRDRAL